MVRRGCCCQPVQSWVIHIPSLLPAAGRHRRCNLQFQFAALACAAGAGQVTLLRDEESGEGDLDLSHLTSAQAKAEAESAERAPTGGDQQPSSQQQVVDLSAAPEAMDTDGQLQAAGGGGEQPPAAAEPDPMSRLPPEMREPPVGECDPVMQVRAPAAAAASPVGCEPVSAAATCALCSTHPAAIPSLLLSRPAASAWLFGIWLAAAPATSHQPLHAPATAAAVVGRQASRSSPS